MLTKNNLPAKLAILLVLITIRSFGQDFKKEIDSIYNFHPHKLSEAEQSKIFPSLDKFFEKIESDTAKYLPLLRRELQSNEHFPYFYYDGGHLLMLKSKSHSDLEITAHAFAKCNIEDLNPKIYVSLVSFLASSNVNTTKAAIKILSDSTFSFYLPQHAMLFNQGYCLMYCLLPLDPAVYVDTLITIFKTTKSISTQKSIITTLWFAYSCSGDSFLKSLNEANTLSKEVVKYANTLLSDNQFNKEYKKFLKTITADGLENDQKVALTRFSDEAIHDLDFVTKARRKNQSCR